MGGQFGENLQGKLQPISKLVAPPRVVFDGAQATPRGGQAGDGVAGGAWLALALGLDEKKPRARAGHLATGRCARQVVTLRLRLPWRLLRLSLRRG